MIKKSFFQKNKFMKIIGQKLLKQLVVFKKLWSNLKNHQVYINSKNKQNIGINKQTLSTAIGFIYTSSCSEDRDISNAAKEILAELGKFSESVEGKGIAFILVIITFLKTIFS